MKLFKRIFAAAVTATLALGSLAALPASAEQTASYQMGDANMDGRVDVLDALLMLQDYTHTMIGAPSILTEEQYALADLDGHTFVRIINASKPYEARSPVTALEAQAVLAYYTCAKLLGRDYTMDDAIAEWVLPYLELHPDRFVQS